MTLNFALRWLSCWIFLWAIWTLPVGAQSQTRTQFAPKSKAATAPPIRQTPSRLVSADVTAQLQAAAAAAAAAHALSLATPAGPAPTPGDASPLAAPNSSSSSTAAAAVAAVPLPVPDVLPLATTPDMTSAASPEQAMAPFVSPELLIAQQIHLGNLPCELGASVRVEADARQPGFFHVHGKGFRYRMFPVQTSTGALRLEDKKAGAVWLQLANKSMLMDQKRGRRMADECAHPDQLAYAQAMKTNPPPSLIDTKGLGR
jgi:hypothetical protein